MTRLSLTGESIVGMACLTALHAATDVCAFGPYGRGSGYRVDPHDPQYASVATSAAEAKRARRNAKRARSVSLPSLSEGE